MRRYFSIDEAEQQIPSLSVLARKARRLKRRIDEYATLRRRIATDGSDAGWESDTSLDSDFHGLVERFYGVVERIEQSGAMLRDVDTGALAFYARFEGRDVCLRWQLGEEHIERWHELDSTDEHRIFRM